MNKFFLLLILFFFFIKNVLASESNNFCYNNSDYIKYNKLYNLDKIEIRFLNQKKWVKNIFSIIRDTGWIENDLKKSHRAKLTFKFKNGFKCKEIAKLRFSGDSTDHYKIIDDFKIITSLNVKLINSNINNITEFKLFLPITRFGDNEIFATNLLRELNFFSPKTKKIQIIFEGDKNEYEYLFQEKISKELIESYGFTEGPILEGDQRFYNTGIEKLNLARIINANWATRSWRNAYISISALSHLNKLYLKFYQSDSHPLNIPYKYLNNQISFFDKNNINNFYDEIVFALGGNHALNPHNRTFYFNFLENNFYPIYYDGNIKWPQNIEYKKISNKKVSKKLSEIDLDKLYNLNSKSGIKVTNKDYTKKNIEKTNQNLIHAELIKSTLNKNKIQNTSYEKYFSKYNDQKIKLIFFDSKPNNFIVCNYDSSNCENKKFSLKEIRRILSQRYNLNDNFRYIFVSDSFDEYYNGEIKEKNNKWVILKIDEIFFAKFIKDKISVNIDTKNRIINIYQKNSDGRIIFYSKNKISNWKIKFNSDQMINLKNQQSKKENLDGCITFYEMNFKNLTLEIKNGACEDSINFIRSNGLIDEINIFNSMSDGLDMDFSNIIINRAKVNKSGNDCVDMSFGKYKIKNLELSNCKDNGISLGEQSTLASNILNVSNSRNAIAVKDSSEANLNSLISKNNKFCFRIYNKKNEFLGGKLNLENLNCDSNYYIDSVSKYKLK